jgi:phosphopantetheinyl transferase (holo-ACP synthase)
MPEITIFNSNDNNFVKRQMTEIEIEELKKTQDKYKIKKEALAAKEAARQALLDKLGITADEAKLLLG